MRGIPTIWIIIGVILVGVVLVTLITGKPPSATTSFSLQANAPNVNPLGQNATGVLV